MITVVTLNPAVDKTYRLLRLEPGRVHRVTEVIRRSGGKGINVARVLKALGCPVQLIGFVGGSNGGWIRSQLAELGIQENLLPIDRETRDCINILDEEVNTQTELLERGPSISTEAWKTFQRRLADLSPESRYVLFCGSLPPGVPNDAYAQLIQLAKESGAQTALDTSGQPLALGLRASPDIIKPNLYELAQITDLDPAEQTQLPSLLTSWNRSGIPLAIVTLGAQGAWAAYREKVFHLSPVPVEALNPVGSGDAFLGGLIAALYQDQPIPKALAWATAAAASNAQHRWAGEIDPDQVMAFVNRVQVSPQEKSI